ncbi:MAG: hypothetical protein PF513_00520 [Tenericutes bacterium]|jgi:hypothetical protein|nr:hypothetical protein [Mycoplasmatota bacterium]
MNKSKNKSKIKIVDDIEIRSILVDIIEVQNKIIASKWAIQNAIRILDLIGYKASSVDLIKRGIEYNKLYNDKLINMNELRHICFEIHRHAKKQDNMIMQSALRAFGHAVSTAHMKNHVIVSSDYIIKVLNLAHENSYEIASEERILQLKELKEIML